MSNSMTIGTLAKQADVNPETIRYYQRRGLFPVPERSFRRIRRYGDADLARLNFIKAAQQLGFTLVEVSELLSLADGSHCHEARGLAERKLRDIRHKLQSLTRMEKTLGELVTRCKADRETVRCPLIDSLQTEKNRLANERRK